MVLRSFAEGELVRHRRYKSGGEPVEFGVQSGALSFNRPKKSIVYEIGPVRGGELEEPWSVLEVSHDFSGEKPSLRLYSLRTRRGRLRGLTKKLLAEALSHYLETLEGKGLIDWGDPEARVSLYFSLVENPVMKDFFEDLLAEDPSSQSHRVQKLLPPGRRKRVLGSGLRTLTMPRSMVERMIGRLLDGEIGSREDQLARALDIVNGVLGKKMEPGTRAKFEELLNSILDEKGPDLDNWNTDLRWLFDKDVFNDPVLRKFVDASHVLAERLGEWDLEGEGRGLRVVGS